MLDSLQVCRIILFKLYKKNTSTSVFEDGHISTHADPIRVASAPDESASARATGPQSPVHTSNNVEATVNIVEATFDFV